MRGLYRTVNGFILLVPGLVLLGLPAGGRAAEPTGGAPHRLVIINGTSRTVHTFTRSPSGGTWTRAAEGEESVMNRAPARGERPRTAPAFYGAASLPLFGANTPAVLPYYGWGFSFYEPDPLTASALLRQVEVGRPWRLDLNQVTDLGSSRREIRAAAWEGEEPSLLQITLKGGGRVKGELVHEGAAWLVLRRGGQEIQVRRSEIKSIHPLRSKQGP